MAQKKEGGKIDTKTVFGFLMIAGGLIYQIGAHYLGIDGGIDQAANGLIAAGLLIIAGKEYINRAKQ